MWQGKGCRSSYQERQVCLVGCLTAWTQILCTRCEYGEPLGGNKTPCTLLRRNFKTQTSRKRSFSKTPFKLEEFETPALRFGVDGKHLDNGAFRKRDITVIVHAICLLEFISNTNPNPKLNDQWLLRFQFFFPAKRERKTSDSLSDWKRRFQIFPT